MNVFRITDLTNQSIKFKVDTNAQQLHLTGCLLLNKELNLVVVEGGVCVCVHACVCVCVCMCVCMCVCVHACACACVCSVESTCHVIETCCSDASVYAYVDEYMHAVHLVHSCFSSHSPCHRTKVC